MVLERGKKDEMSLPIIRYIRNCAELLLGAFGSLCRGGKICVMSFRIGGNDVDVSHSCLKLGLIIIFVGFRFQLYSAVC